MSDFSQHITNLALTELGSSSKGNKHLNNTLRLLAKWRSTLIQNTLIKEEGTVVKQGLVAGLDFVENSSEGCHIAKLLGCYEQPLQPYISELISRQYDNLVNIGCAEGYYAVGLARLLPNTKSYAYDTDPKARDACRALAIKNRVSDRVTIGELFTPEDFKKYEGTNTLVFCDIEGAERDLLDPIVSPALKTIDIIVESHECLTPGITEELISRFSTTHAITQVNDNGSRNLDKMPSWFTNLAHLDQILGTWEWRSGPTPWLVMTAYLGVET